MATNSQRKLKLQMDHRKIHVISKLVSVTGLGRAVLIRWQSKRKGFVYKHGFITAHRFYGKEHST